ncbi:MAG: hypothetical protein ACR2N5_02940 [Solirubrobacterales bacterium]
MNEPARPTEATTHRDRLYEEAVTMSMYLAIVLYAALIALPEEDRLDRWVAIATIWGTSIGLAAAHVFSFGVAARLVARGRPELSERHIAMVQLVAAMVVAALASIPLAILGTTNTAYEVAESILGAIIGVAAFVTARRAGVGLRRSFVITAVIVLIAALIIAFKAAVGH